MEIDYLDLISPEPFVIQGVGSIRPYTLRDVARLTNRVYSTYIALLGISPETYCTQVNTQLKDWYQNLTDDQKLLLGMYDIAVSTHGLQQSFAAILNFFFLETVIYDPEKDAFLLWRDDQTYVGMINKSNYSEVCSIILKFNHIDNNPGINLAKVKNKKGLARYLEMQKRKEKQNPRPRTNPNLELGNIISAVCARHHSVNYTNVWDMTIYQLWDTFARLRSNDIYECGKTAVSIWGDKENKFDFNSWFKNILN